MLETLYITLRDIRRTLGLRIVALEPANLLRGRMAKLLMTALVR